VKDISPESPEQRRIHPGAHPHGQGWRSHFAPGSRPFETLRRIVVGVYSDGFMHAGNLAYLTLLTLFPFFIITAAFAHIFGQTDKNMAAIHGLLETLPPSIAAMVETTAQQTLSARTGPLLWLGALVGLWTVTSFIETIRDILRRAYGTGYARPFWQYRLIGIVIVVLSVGLMMLAFVAQIMLTAVEEIITRFIPAAQHVTDGLAASRFLPVLVMFTATFLMFWSLAPTNYRGRAFPKWPGALFTTLWWYSALTLLPRILAQFGGYTLTYGGLAGVIVALLFFWLVGYGIVIGAHINAALANPERSGLRANNDDNDVWEAQWLDT
jgi:membrane protein